MILLRYFAKEVFLAMFAVAGVVLVISLGWRFNGYLEQAAAGGLEHEILLVLMAYRLPGFLELIVPVSFFLAILLAYGRFYVDNEMIVLHACGVSAARVLAMTLAMALVVTAATAAITFWAKPWGERQVEALLTGQKQLTDFDALQSGRFQSLAGGQRVTYAEDYSDAGHLSGVFINTYAKRAGGAVEATTLVSSGGKTLVDEQGRAFLLLHEGARYRGTPGSKGYQVVRYKEYRQLLETGSLKQGRARRAAMPTSALLSATEPKALSELHWRIGVVLLAPVLALMALPLARVNPRQGRYARLLPAMVLCFLYLISLSSARSGLEAEQLPMAYGLWWVHGIALLIVLGLSRLPSRGR